MHRQRRRRPPGVLHAARLAARALASGNPERRYAARFELLSGIARRLGFRLYNRNLLWLDEPEFSRAWRQFPASDRVTRDRKFILYSIARSIADLPGDTAECGVYDGGSSFLICLAREGRGHHRHHVFDSFEGLSAPGRQDSGTDETAYRWHEHDLAVPIEEVKRNLARFDFVQFYKGWIPERFPEVADRRFSFVHVDVDLYQPTLDAIRFFSPRMVPGGVLLCDDYGSTLCPGAKRAFDESVASLSEGPVIHLTTGQGLIIKRAQ